MGRDDARHEVSVRLARIEGHVRSIREMVQAGRPADEVLTQLQAVRGALTAAGRVCLMDHLETSLDGASPQDLDERAMAALRESLRRFVE